MIKVNSDITNKPVASVDKVGFILRTKEEIYEMFDLSYDNYDELPDITVCVGSYTTVVSTDFGPHHVVDVLRYRNDMLKVSDNGIIRKFKIDTGCNDDAMRHYIGYLINKIVYKYQIVSNRQRIARLELVNEQLTKLIASRTI